MDCPRCHQTILYLQDDISNSPSHLHVLELSWSLSREADTPENRNGSTKMQPDDPVPPGQYLENSAKSEERETKKKVHKPIYFKSFFEILACLVFVSFK